MVGEEVDRIRRLIEHLSLLTRLKGGSSTACVWRA
jgi:hypothetical protein